MDLGLSILDKWTILYLSEFKAESAYCLIRP